MLVDHYRAENSAELAAQITALKDQAAATAGPAAEELLKQASVLQMQAINWQQVWLAPCLFAGAVMAIFFLFFHDRSVKAGEITEEQAAAAGGELDGAP
ncbi:MAG: hypothetical protein KJZ65_04370 [Phycisphaerales bacterium]|nr:hypothetical protein [Phycisphaerales bacterium]